MGKKTNVLGGIFLAGVFATAIVSLFDDTPSAAEAAKLTPSDRVQKALADVRSVKSADTSKLATEGKVSIVVLGGSIFEGGNATKEALEAVKKSLAGTPYPDVSVRLDEKLVDGYGRESDEAMLLLTYSKDDLEKMNFKNLIGWDLLNLAEVEKVSPLSGKIARQECEPGSDNARFANAFCAVATND